MTHIPEWSGVVEGYAVNYINRNLWKFTPLYDVDDLLSEAYIMFMYVRDRYVTETPKHFVALFKMALSQHLMDINLKKSRLDANSGGIPFQDETLDPFESVLDHFDVLAEHVLIMDLAEADASVKLLIERAQTYRGSRKRRLLKRGRETTNDVLCRIAGLQDKLLASRLEELLGFPFQAVASGS